ncbi:TIGR03943 family protein [Paenibacillus sophorae]|uniref:TIGR03943 family protein n=1 Tax=Paenibacillus sophorae TaxID=1333845 RepID=A0A1H8TT29_9BACL|nr:TIGR03943 family protein [Paenibacillus sophorae]QWU18021.1 TIGR03943 family protein [Paenibacillus sophorae]SEO94172.1 TIGR03943 family protein [Paenibacillus sophorae]
MYSSGSVKRHYIFRAAVLLAFAVYIEHLARHDALHYYVTPRLAVWVRLCPVPLSLMALSLAIQALFGGKSAICGCGHQLPRSRAGSAAMYGVFLLPLLLGFALPNRALGSAAAAHKGMSLNYTSLAAKESSRFQTKDPFAAEFAALAKKLYTQPVIPVYPQIFSETLGTLDMFKHDFKGKEVVVNGFLYHENTGSMGGRFVVSRFLVQCCTADATPLGILVDAKQQKSLPADTWIKVRGKLQVVVYKGKETLQIDADSVTPVEQSSTPYVYTSPDSVEEWNQLQTAAK